MHLGLVALVVDDYDDAIAFFVDALGFELVEDTPRDGKRWVVVRPDADAATALLLAQAASPQQSAAVGNQHGGRVGFFLNTDDFGAQYDRMQKAGVTFTEQPRHEDYGSVVVFEDLYGNRWDLIEPR